MSAENLNWILAGLAVLGAIGNIIAYFSAKRELRQQQKETRELAKITSVLEHKVHRMAVQLDHRIYRLERVRDLITGQIKVSIGLRQGSREPKDWLDLAIERGMASPELDALIMAIDDKELKEQYLKLRSILLDSIWPLMWNKVAYDDGTADNLIKQQSEYTMHMHRRILALFEKTTKDEEKAPV